jgi:hypothetical protein
MKVAAAVTTVASISALIGTAANVAYIAMAVVLIVGIMAILVLLLKGIAPHIELGRLRVSFRRLPRPRSSGKQD